jgi:hypothetical protein
VGTAASAVRLAKPRCPFGREGKSVHKNKPVFPPPAAETPVSPFPPVTGGLKTSIKTPISPPACPAALANLSGKCLQFVKTAGGMRPVSLVTKFRVPKLIA